MSEHPTPRIAESLTYEQDAVVDVIALAQDLNEPDITVTFESHNQYEEPDNDHRPSIEERFHDFHIEAMLLHWSPSLELQDAVSLCKTREFRYNGQDYKLRTQQIAGYTAAKTHYLLGVELVWNNSWEEGGVPFVTEHSVALAIHHDNHDRNWKILHGLHFTEVLTFTHPDAVSSREIQKLADPATIEEIDVQFEALLGDVTDHIYKLSLKSLLSDEFILDAYRLKVEDIMCAYNLPPTVSARMTRSYVCLLREHIKRERTALAVRTVGYNLLHPEDLNSIRTMLHAITKNTDQ
jgi:hypothetical protein